MQLLFIRAGAALLSLFLPQVASAAVDVPCGDLAGCSGSTHNYIPDVVAVLDASFSSYIPWIGVLFILVAGGYMVISAGSDEKINKGKETLIWAAMGIFVAWNAATFSGFVSQEAGTIVNSATGSNAILGILQGYLANPDPAINPLIGLLDIALLGYCLFCGMKMVATRGDDGAYEEGRKGLLYAAIGAVIMNLSFVIATSLLN